MKLFFKSISSLEGPFRKITLDPIYHFLKETKCRKITTEEKLKVKLCISLRNFILFTNQKQVFTY